MEVVAWLVLRIVYAWMFLYPLVVLLRDFNATVNVVSLVAPFAKEFFTYVMLAVMFFGALMVLLGVYAQIAGFMLCAYCIIGQAVHYKLAKQTLANKLSDMASEEDKQVLSQTIQLGVMGQVTSAEKNAVLAAVGFFIMLMGSGPMSITANLW